MRIELPEPALVLLIGPSGAGKSTFGRKHFRPTEVLNSDTFRALIADDENAQEVTADAFATLRFIAGRRLNRGRLTVIDATSLHAMAREPFVDLARRFQVPLVGIVFDLPEPVSTDRNLAHRRLRSDVFRRQQADLRRSLPLLKGEGVEPFYVLDSEQVVNETVVVRRPWRRSAELVTKGLP